MLCVEDLSKLALFQYLPLSRLHWVCERVQKVELAAGATLVQEGDPARGLFLLIAGEIGITRLSEGVDIPLGQHKAPEFLGEVPILTDEPILVTLRALTDCLTYELAGDDFRTLLHECRDFERAVFRVMARRLRGVESFVRGREKMAALGTLAAGLAHELNNPATAVVQALRDVIPALAELQRMNLVYGQRQVEAAHTQQWLQVRDAGYETILHDRLDLAILSEHEEELLEWLETYGVAKAWNLAAPLASGGVTIETLDNLTTRWQADPTELRDMGVRWLALSFDVMSMLKSGLHGAERITALVQSMKAYSYLDQGVQQVVDVHQGLEDTLQIFSHRLKPGIEVQRCYDRDLPQLKAYGSELNQVWTHLIENAIDAMEGNGRLKITTTRTGHSVCVAITDSGRGIPPEIQSRIFESFFTTKPVGEGTGLGLDIVRRIVENRHRGTIALESQPGETRFSVQLPLATLNTT
ncbi:cyclic nucleotide-binding domain-containing protein [Phormidium sp. FACHB-592]|uniref:histidine kinase n=1 Tax=Stenomitos frigidus AS-A4 TaxID=2933935 RepID=A0ABV0KUV4_9CYAN|nr:ATP-binding protein [Phormidium sp. FACHB-592]MBD2074622.1 cyclic nucleotide-binding domain-containing protein [Phormidium sp. FACHB-592]